jgi:hypothetical protein
MGDPHLRGPTRGDHKFTVASMVSRRAGRTFSDLACGTGGLHIRTVLARAGVAVHELPAPPERVRSRMGHGRFPRPDGMPLTRVP